MPARIAPEVDSEIRRLTEAGVAVREIARRVGLHRRTVQRYRSLAGISGPVTSRMSDDEIAMARSLLEDGASYAEVSRTLRRSHQAISRNVPGFKWDWSRCGEASAMARQMAKLERSGKF